MADVEYSVAAILQLTGGDDVKAKLGQVGAASDKAQGSLAKIGQAGARGISLLGEHVNRGIDMLAKYSTAAALAGGAIAGGLAVKGIKTGLIDVNAKLEQASLGFATLFQKFGAAPTFASGLGVAKDLIEGIRQDAKALPGEFGDFVGMAQTLTAPMLNLGKGAQDIRNFTRDAVVSAAALGINFDQAAREAAMLLEGHAGGHNIFGTRLGITASTKVGGKDWHEATAASRYEYLTKLLKTNDDVLKANQNSWSGLTSTLVDSGKRFVGIATQPLFERAKASMKQLLSFTDSHESQLDRIATLVGTKIGVAYDWVEKQAKKIPDHWESAKRHVHELTDALDHGFKKAWPIIEKIGTFLGKELEHPATALKHLAEIKVGAMAAQAAPSLLSGGMQFAKMFAGAGGGAAAAGAGAEGLAGLAGGGGGAAAAATTAGGPVALAALAAAAAVVVAAIDNVGGAYDRLKTTMTDLWTSVSGVIGPVVEKGGFLRDTFGRIGSNIVTVLQIGLYPIILGFKQFALALDLINVLWRGVKAAGEWLWKFFDIGLGGALTAAVDAGKSFLAWLGKIKDWILGLPGISALLKKGDQESDIGLFKGRKDGDPNAPENRAARQGLPGVPQGMLDQGKVHPGTTVDMRGAKVEIKLDVRDQDPDRIVRRVFDAVGRYVARPVTTAATPAGA